MDRKHKLSVIGGIASCVLLFNWVGGINVYAAGLGEGTGRFPPGSRVLKTTYFNQWLEPNGSKFPAEGWKMCGAASAVIAISKYNKPISLASSSSAFKAYMYKDQSIDGNKTPVCGINQGGAFTLTNTGCKMSYLGGIQKYITKYGQSFGLISKDINLVKRAIDSGHPIIFNFSDQRDSNFGHIATIVGYTPDNKIIVHDTYTNVQNIGRIWKTYYTGQYAIYDLYSSRWPIGYLLEVK